MTVVSRLAYKNERTERDIGCTDRTLDITYVEDRVNVRAIAMSNTHICKVDTFSEHISYRAHSGHATGDLRLADLPDAGANAETPVNMLHDWPMIAQTYLQGAQSGDLVSEYLSRAIEKDLQE